MVIEMSIKEAMRQADREAGATGIFYHPSTMDAVFAEHGQQPPGYLIWCDCSKAVRAIELYGIEGAYDSMSH